MNSPHRNRSIVATIITIIMMIGLATPSVMAQRTTRRGLRAESIENQQKSNIDTIAITPTTHNIKISGYDKPLRSSKETFFISNHTAYNILGIRLNIEYIDLKGRTLHQNQHHISLSIPTGATRQAFIKSWDVQKSFYYKHSSKPRIADGTPYDIRYQIISIDVQKDSNNKASSLNQE